MPRFEFRYPTSRAFFRAVTRRYLRDNFGWDYWLCVAALGGAALWSESTLWAVCAGVGSLLPLLLYRLWLSRGDDLLNRMATPHIEVVLDDEGLQTRSDLGESRLHWKSLTKLQLAPEAYLFFLTWANYIAIPREVLTPEAVDFAQDRMRAAGAKIKVHRSLRRGESSRAEGDPSF